MPTTTSTTPPRGRGLKCLRRVALGCGAFPGRAGRAAGVGGGSAWGLHVWAVVSLRFIGVRPPAVVIGDDNWLSAPWGPSAGAALRVQTRRRSFDVGHHFFYVSLYHFLAGVSRHRISIKAVVLKLVEVQGQLDH